MRIGPLDYNLYANSQVDSMEEINKIPLKTIGQTSVLVGDVGEAKDAAQIQTNLVRVDGQRSVYLPVLKQGGDTNTIALVLAVRAASSCSTVTRKPVVSSANTSTGTAPARRMGSG